LSSPPNPTPSIYPLSLHDALPICPQRSQPRPAGQRAGTETPYLRAAPWSASTWATHAVTFTPVGRSMNSFGPWAFEPGPMTPVRSEEHTSELQSRGHLVCRLLLEK